jgi:hypothetical protein
LYQQGLFLLKRLGSLADAAAMRIVGLLLATVIVLFLAVQQMKTQGPQSKQVSTAIEQGSQFVAGGNLQSAKPILDLQFTSTQSYAGADVASAGVTLVRADATSYCIQAGAGNAVEHLEGPTGAPAPGPC